MDLNKEEMSYLIHDMALYDIPNGLSESIFISHIKEKFNTHPFILELKNYINHSDRQSLNYGSVVRWIQNNTTTVPTPRSWEIKQEQIVNILYEWICFFDNNYSWDIPGRKTQVIYYQKGNS